MLGSRRLGDFGSGIGIGVEPRSARVYGWAGREKMTSVGPSSTMLAQVDHRDAVGQDADHRKIVGDEEVGETKARLEVGQEAHDLGLDRDVE